MPGAWYKPFPPAVGPSLNSSSSISSSSALSPKMAVSLVSPGSNNPSSGGAYYVPAWRYVHYGQMMDATRSNGNANSSHNNNNNNTPPLPAPPSNASSPRPATPAAIHSLFPVASSRLPSNLPRDPRQWSREEVRKWLAWCQDEFDLPPIDVNQFQMNGKALCLLMKSDFNERAPQCGDVLHNAAHLFVLQATSPSDESHRQRYDQQLRMYSYSGGSLLSSEPTPAAATNWATAWPFVSSDYHNVGHVIHQSRFGAPPSGNGNGNGGGGIESTVTLSPATSPDSQSGSGRHHDDDDVSVGGGASKSNMAAAAAEEDRRRNHSHSHSHHSDRSQRSTDSGGSDCGSPPPAHSGNGGNLPMKLIKPRINGIAENNGGGGGRLAGLPPVPEQPVTNGRLLWDFLHQLLNDPSQRYSRCIAWKEREAGVFKIVDPHGLAQLWGMQKNHLNMNFDKMSRALRYYYRVNILKKVQGERHCYQFLRQPIELKACKQRALLSKYCNGLQQPSGKANPAEELPQPQPPPTPPVAIKCEGDA